MTHSAQANLGLHFMHNLIQNQYILLNVQVVNDVGLLIEILRLRQLVHQLMYIYIVVGGVVVELVHERPQPVLGLGGPHRALDWASIWGTHGGTTIALLVGVGKLCEI